MDLMKLKPKESKFKLAIRNEPFSMRPISLADEVWLSEEYGDKKIQEIFENIDIKNICRIVYRLIEEKDKLFFKAKEVTIIDENGVEETMMLGGYKLLMTMVHGKREQVELINSLIENIGLSRPEPSEEPKKKAIKKKRKQTGQKSSI